MAFAVPHEVDQEVPSHPPGLWQPPRAWNEPPSVAAVVATAACGVPYLVMLLLGVASGLPVTLGGGFARALALTLSVAGGVVLIGALGALRTARRTGKVADRTLAAVCTVAMIAYLPLAAITVGIAYALAGR